MRTKKEILECELSENQIKLIDNELSRDLRKNIYDAMAEFHKYKSEQEKKTNTSENALSIKRAISSFFTNVGRR